MVRNPGEISVPGMQGSVSGIPATSRAVQGGGYDAAPRTHRSLARIGCPRFGIAWLGDGTLAALWMP